MRPSRDAAARDVGSGAHPGCEVVQACLKAPHLYSSPVRILPICLVLAALLAGCISARPGPDVEPTPEVVPPPHTVEGAWRVSACDLGTARAGAPSPPDLLAVTEPAAGGSRRVHRLTFADGEYRVAHEARVTPADAAGPQGRVAVATRGDDAYLYAWSAEAGHHVVRLDATLAPRERFAMENVGALHARGDVLYAASDRLVTLDADDLRRLGEVALPLKDSYAGKVAHDVLVHGGVAFLLDDVVVPLYVLRVDVSDPEKPRALDRQQIEGGHLPGHWLEPARGRWMILQTWGGMGGGHTSLHVLPMGGGPQQGEALTLSRSSWEPGSGKEPTVEGWSIQATLETTPPWAIVARGAEARFGSLQVNDQANRVTFCERPLVLPPRDVDGPFPGSGLVRSGAHVAGLWGSTLFVVDVEASPPALVVAQKLPERLAALRAYGAGG